jgi:hypothetical protein
MNWVDVLIIVTANFFAVFFAVFIMSVVREYKEAKRKSEFLERMFSQVIDRAETDVQFRNIMGWNFRGDERDDNDKR